MLNKLVFQKAYAAHILKYQVTAVRGFTVKTEKEQSYSENDAAKKTYEKGSEDLKKNPDFGKTTGTSAQNLE